MEHLTIKRAWWSNVADDFGNVRYGLETHSGNRDIQWLAPSVGAAEAAARALGAEHGVSAELVDFVGRAAARKALAERVSQRAHETASEKAGEGAVDFAVSDTHSIDHRVALTTAGGIRPVPGYRLKCSAELAALYDKARTTVFAIVDHPEHGLIGVSPREFGLLGLPEVVLGRRSA